MSPTTRTCESFEAVLSLSYFFAGAQCLYLQYSSSFCDRSVPAFQRCAKQTSPGCSMRNVCISHHVLLHAVPVFRLSAINHGVLCQRAIVSHRVQLHAVPVFFRLVGTAPCLTVVKSCAEEAPPGCCTHWRRCGRGIEPLIVQPAL